MLQEKYTKNQVLSKQVYSVNGIVKIGLLSAIAVVLMYMDFPLPVFPAFLKFDFSDLPALLGAFALGPVAGVVIELLKNALIMLVKGTHTGGVGELANFIIGVGFVVPASMVYIKIKSRKGAIIGMVAGAVTMGVLGALANYFVIIPLYQKIMPLEAIIAMASAANKAIVDVKTYVVYAVIPFNLLKATVISLITLLIYKKVSPILHV